MTTTRSRITAHADRVTSPAPTNSQGEAPNLSSLRSIAYQAAKKEGLSPCDAEEVTSMTLTNYLKAAHTVEHPTAWTIAVARRTSWALRKRTQRHLALGEAPIVPVESVGRQTEWMETRLDLKAALSKLQPKDRHVLISRYVEGKNLGVIAESTGVSQSTVKRRLQRGRESLRRALTGRSLRRHVHLDFAS